MGLLGYLVDCNVSNAWLFGQKDRLSLLEMLELKERWEHHEDGKRRREKKSVSLHYSAKISQFDISLYCTVIILLGQLYRVTSDAINPFYRLRGSVSEFLLV